MDAAWPPPYDPFAIAAPKAGGGKVPYRSGLMPILAMMALAGAVEAAEGDHRSAYAGEEAREIKSLSQEDIDDLLEGRGWGFAKAAELNGLPGPAHLLEMKDEIGLEPEQESEIRALFEAMRADAMALGEQLVAGERDLDRLFRSGDVDPAEMGRLLDKIESVRRDLRETHLSAHLKTPAILSDDQIEAYNRLRGYDSDDDPCAAVPEGHDPAMWKKHNGCA